MIFLIGGMGFVGSRVSEILQRDEVEHKIGDLRVDIATPQESNEYWLDVTDLDTLKALRGASVIINLAAEHRDDVRPLSRYHDVNVRGAKNVCDAARDNDIQTIIFTSSVAVYGFAPANTSEKGAINPFNEYGKTKFEAEEVYTEWALERPHERVLVIVRPTVIFGEGNRGNVYNLLRQIASRKFLMFGDGENIKSMAYVENIASFLVYTKNMDSGVHIYNYIDKPDLSMNTLISEVRKTLFGKNNVGIRFPAFIGIFIGYIADVVAKVTGRNLPVSSIRVKKFMGTTQFSSSVRDTGFVPPVRLEDGLASTLRYEFLEDNSDKRTFKTE